MDLVQQIDVFRRYFLDRATQLYTPSLEEGFDYKFKAFTGQSWLTHPEAMRQYLMQPADEMPAALYHLQFYKQHVNTVLDWLSLHDVVELLSRSDGSIAKIFEVRFKNESSFVPMAFRLGLHKDSINSITQRDVQRPWCPLTLQANVTNVVELKSGGVALSLELMPLVGSGIEHRIGNAFEDFLNQYVLPGTVHEAMYTNDFGICRDGTPLSLDPGDLNFRSNALAVHCATLQFDKAWQQEQMAIIYENCLRVNLPEPLTWVLKRDDGSFTTKQSNLYPHSIQFKSRQMSIVPKFHGPSLV